MKDFKKDFYKVRSTLNLQAGHSTIPLHSSPQSISISMKMYEPRREESESWRVKGV